MGPRHRPGRAIVLIECSTSSSPDLYQGVMTAAALRGVSVVSMSWGSAETAAEVGFDGDFTTPTGHQGVTFVAATGDTGARACIQRIRPMCSPSAARP